MSKRSGTSECARRHQAKTKRSLWRSAAKRHIRPELERQLRGEELESREMLAFDAFSQLAVELVNRARMNPTAELARNPHVSQLNAGLPAGTINGAAKPPLAPNALLEQASLRHNNDMRLNNLFSHTGSDGSSAGQRIAQAGYIANGRSENLAAVPYFHPTLNNVTPNPGVPDGQAPRNLTAAVHDLHDVLFANAAHRRNMLNPAYKELGIHVQQFRGPYQVFGALDIGLSTEVYAAGNYASAFTGVVIDDGDNDNFYDVGEGIGGVTIAAYQGNTLVAQTVSLSSGGYVLALPAGNYQLRAIGNGVNRARTATLGSQHAKVDFESGADPGGIVRGTVFLDSNENGSRGASEPALSGRTVFIDTNGNGRWDNLEPRTTTDNGGGYQLSTTSTASVDVVLISQFGFRASAAGFDSHTVTVTPGQSVNNQNFARFRDVQVSGNAASVFGTSRSDSIRYTALTRHFINVNGLAYSLNPAVVDTVRIHGQSSEDSLAVLTGTGSDFVTMRPTLVTVNGVLTDAGGNPQNYRLEAAGFSDVDVDLQGGARDLALLIDGIGNDTLFAHPTTARLQGLDYDLFVRGFETMRASAENGGFDRAFVTDSAGNDRLISRPSTTILRAANNDYSLRFDRFERNFVYATGGVDDAFMYDSPAADLFTGRPESAIMRASDSSYLNYAEGFDRVYAFATAGGFDLASFVASTGDDRYTAAEGYAVMRGVNYNYRNQAERFERTYAYGGQGGDDRALFYGSANDDRFTGYATSSIWRAVDGAFYHTVFDFAVSAIDASQGGFDRAVLQDGPGDDLYYSRGNESYLFRDGYLTRVAHVEAVTLQGTSGPTNTLDVASVDYALSVIGDWV